LFIWVVTQRLLFGNLFEAGQASACGKFQGAGVRYWDVGFNLGSLSRPVSSRSVWGQESIMLRHSMITLIWPNFV